MKLNILSPTLDKGKKMFYLKAFICKPYLHVFVHEI